MTLPAGENRLLFNRTNVDGEVVEIKKNDRKVFGFCVYKTERKLPSFEKRRKNFTFLS